MQHLQSDMCVYSEQHLDDVEGRLMMNMAATKTVNIGQEPIKRGEEYIAIQKATYLYKLLTVMSALIPMQKLRNMSKRVRLDLIVGAVMDVASIEEINNYSKDVMKKIGAWKNGLTYDQMRVS